MKKALSYLGEGYVTPYSLAAQNRKYLVRVRTVKDAAVPHTHPLLSARRMDYDSTIVSKSSDTNFIRFRDLLQIQRSSDCN